MFLYLILLFYYKLKKYKKIIMLLNKEKYGMFNYYYKCYYLLCFSYYYLNDYKNFYFWKKTLNSQYFLDKKNIINDRISVQKLIENKIIFKEITYETKEYVNCTKNMKQLKEIVKKD